jgi:cation diffusion facilitator family transporter
LALGLGAAFARSASQLALAQAVDSFLDAATGIALLWALHVAQKPPDLEHPAGHRPAEPIAALVVAVLAGAMAVEVLRSAAETLLVGNRPELPLTLLFAFGAKVLAKTGIAMQSLRASTQAGPAVRAIFVDARNDVLSSSLSVFGYFIARSGWPAWDAWLALPTGVWILLSAVWLAQENIGMLMGQIASEAKHEHLRSIVESVPGVRSVHDLVARYHGTHLDVRVHVVLDDDLVLRVAHDIGQAVHLRLLGESDVGQAHVHLDVEDDREADASAEPDAPRP